MTHSNKQTVEVIPVEMKQAISFMRQWLNEDRITDDKRTVGNDDLWHWLEDGYYQAIETAKDEGMKEGLQKSQEVLDEMMETAKREEGNKAFRAGYLAGQSKEEPGEAYKKYLTKDT